MKKVLLVILFAFLLYVPRASASIIYSNSFGTIDSDGTIDSTPSGGHGFDIYVNSQNADFTQNCSSGDRPYGGCSLGAGAFGTATSSIQDFLDSYSVTYPHSTFVCLAGIGTYPTPCVTWVYLTIDTSTATAFDSRTRVVDFTPANGDVTATSTTFTYHAYINPDDTSTFYSWKLSLDYQKQASGDTPHDLLFTNATTTGDIYFTVTKDLTAGNYIVNASIKKVYFGVVNDPLTLFSGGDNPYHQFVVGTSTYLGDLFQNNIKDIQHDLDTASATTTQARLAQCNPLHNFDIKECLFGVFIPSPQETSDLITNFEGTFLSKAPWGYAYKAYSDLTATTTSDALPALTYTFNATGTPAVLLGKKLNFTPWLMLTGSSSPLRTQYGTFLDSFTTWFNTIWLIGFAFVLIKEFFGHDHGYAHEHKKQ